MMIVVENVGYGEVHALFCWGKDMTMLQAIVTIVCSLIAGSGGAFALMQFLIKRKDEKEENDVQKRIDEAVAQTKREMMEELEKVSLARSEEGAVRFKTHAESIEEINKQISQNSKQIGELTDITQQVLKSMDSLNQVVTVSAESQRNSTYDRLLIVTNKILKSGKMTIADKTNLRQLYASWKALKGDDPKMETMYDECLKLNPILED